MRIDIFLVEKGFAKSRSVAQTLIASEVVSVNGKKVLKNSEQIDENAENDVLVTQRPKYVGRGGYKLEYALEKFNINVDGMTAIDIGASTGGFTDCLLQKGAKKVYSVDTGVDQLDVTLRSDKRVINMEKYNARNLKVEDFSETIDIAVIDVSFISQTLIIPSLVELLPDGALLVSLIKPQFEVGKRCVGKNGIVKNFNDRINAVKKVVDFVENCGLGCIGVSESAITGGDGNIEYISVFKKGAQNKISIELQR